MNWNILADLYASESVYPYCERWALSWNWRKHLIVKELKSMAADIITLQEVQKDAYDDWFKPQLAEAGFEVSISRRNESLSFTVASTSQRAAQRSIRPHGSSEL